MPPKAVCRHCGLRISQHRLATTAGISVIVCANGDWFEAKEETEMSVIRRLADFNADRAEINDMVELAVQAQAVRTGFETMDIPVPEALVDGLKTVQREIARRQEDVIERRLRELDAADAADRSASERKEDRKAERERLLAKKGQPA